MLALNPQVTKVSKTKSFNGYEFDIYSDSWQLDKNNLMRIEFINNFNALIQDDIRDTLVYFAETCASSHACNMSRAIKNYYDKTESKLITELGLLKFKSVYSNKNEEYRLGALRVFLKQLYLLGFKAVSESLYDLLNSWRLSGNDKGLAVLSLDPEEGPYSDIEFEAIKSGLDNKYAESRITTQDYVLAQLFACTGRRTIQISSLKICDLSLDKKTLSQPTYMLNIPRAKVRGGRFRGSFTKFALDEYVGQVIEIHINNIKLQVKKLLNRSIQNDLINLIPLFPDNLEDLKYLSELEMEQILKTDALHMKSGDISDWLRSVIDTLKIASERTGKSIVTTGYRFRYTLGTRAAREGAGVLTIATLLDHSDTQNTKVYVANIPEHAATISTIMNGSLMRYANAFQGEVVLSEEVVLDKLSNAPRIRSIDSKSNLGSCGTCSSCHQYAPVACYVCPKFKPWRDAPHEIILKWLLDERERIKIETSDLEIAAINDRVIIAVNQVIERCTQLKEVNEYDQ